VVNNINISSEIKRLREQRYLSEIRD